MFELLNDMRGQILFMSYEGNQTPLTSEGERLESSVSVICDIFCSLRHSLTFGFLFWEDDWPGGGGHGGEASIPGGGLVLHTTGDRDVSLTEETIRSRLHHRMSTKSLPANRDC